MSLIPPRYSHNKLINLLTIGTLLALLASYSSSFVSPATCSFLFFFSFLYPITIAVTLALLVVTLFLKSKNALYLALALFLGIPYHLKHVGLNSHDNSLNKAFEAHRVMSYNVHFFRFPEALKNEVEAKEGVMRLISRYEPDILCVQEFLARKTGNFNTTETLQQHIKLKHYYIHKALESHVEYYGLALFTKYPILSCRFLRLDERPNTVNSCLIADLKIDDKTVRVFNAHLASVGFNVYDTKFYKKFLGGAGINNLKIYDIMRKLREAAILRARQADILAKEIAVSPYPVIVAGDFNDTPMSYTYAAISRGLTDAFLAKGSGFLKTYKGVFPNFRIDYLLAGKFVKVVKFISSESSTSDHVPIAMDFMLND